MQRYHSFRDTVYSLEPDVKNNPGGLRDLHIMQWLAIKNFHATKDDDLCSVGLLTNQNTMNTLPASHSYGMYAMLFTATLTLIS